MSPPLAQAAGPQVALILLTVVVGLVAFSTFLLFAMYFNLWVQAKMTEANVGMLDLIGMSFRKVNPNIIVRSKIMAIQAGLSEEDGMTTRGLEAHHLAGGDVTNVVAGLIEARRAGIPLSFEEAAAIDLDGYDVVETLRQEADIDAPPGP